MIEQKVFAEQVGEWFESLSTSFVDKELAECLSLIDRLNLLIKDKKKGKFALSRESKDNFHIIYSLPEIDVNLLESSLFYISQAIQTAIYYCEYSKNASDEFHSIILDALTQNYE